MLALSTHRQPCAQIGCIFCALGGERASRVLFRDPGMAETDIRAMAERLGKIDWSLFNTR